MCRALLRKPYPSDVSDEEWSLVVPYLTLMTEAAPQREHSLRELFNALRYVIRYGIAWRAILGCGVSAISALAGVGVL
jgi:transposase